MGLVTKLITHVVLAPVTAPIYGVRFVIDVLARQAESELRDEEKRLKEELVALNMRLETGDISQEEFESQETVLLSKLRAFHESDAGHESGAGHG
jgi:hypothetical protein